MAPDNFCVFILTHRRPRHQYTLSVLTRNNYTGPVYLLVDSEDPTLDEYRDHYGERVIVFDKEIAAEMTDLADNSGDRRGSVFPRNYTYLAAAQLGIRYFLALDDDYTYFAYTFDDAQQYRYTPVRNLDEAFSAMLDFYQTTPVRTIAFAQSGDFIGGGSSAMATQIWAKRKAMNSFFCDTERPIRFMGIQNEDVNAYTLLGARGEIFLQMNHIRLNQLATQSNEGGLTESYLEHGTYYKSFYSVMHCPSFVTIEPMGPVHPRLHHKISWRHAVPKIIREDLRKPRVETSTAEEVD